MSMIKTGVALAPPTIVKADRPHCDVHPFHNPVCSACVKAVEAAAAAGAP